MPRRPVQDSPPVMKQPHTGGTPFPNGMRMLSGKARPYTYHSITKLRSSSSPTVMLTVMASSGSRGSIFSGHSTRHRSPE